MVTGRGVRIAAPALALLLAAVGVPVAVAAQQMGSGRIVKMFLDAVIREDWEAAGALLVDEPELQTPDGSVLIGREAVLGFFAALERPIVLGDQLPWGGGIYEAHLVAGATGYIFYFHGAGGVIAFIEVAREEPAARPPDRGTG
jgi:hypothetical protein